MMVFAAALLSAGCSGKGRLAVSGSVTVDDSPLATGTVSFQPAEEHLGSAGGSIVAGKFELPAAHGLKPGQYLVTITGYRETGRMIKDYQRGMIAESVPIVFKETMPLAQTIAAQPSPLEFKLHSAPR